VKPNETLIALLIDGDNARPSLLRSMIEETSKHGKVTIRRIYGDWTSSNMSSWKKTLNDASFTPIQQFAYTTGKNSTDSSLIIDAMDILHTGNVDGFCIVSSDSDYTALARRIREQGIFVMGIGEKQTPPAFVQSCELFVYTDAMNPDLPVPEQPASPDSGKKSGRQAKAKADPDIIHKAYDSAIHEQDPPYISTIGTHVRYFDADFDPRKFGHKTLIQLFSNLPAYEVFYIGNKPNRDKQAAVRRRTG